MWNFFKILIAITLGLLFLSLSFLLTFVFIIDDIVKPSFIKNYVLSLDAKPLEKAMSLTIFLPVSKYLNNESNELNFILEKKEFESFKLDINYSTYKKLTEQLEFDKTQFVKIKKYFSFLMSLKYILPIILVIILVSLYFLYFSLSKAFLISSIYLYVSAILHFVFYKVFISLNINYAAFISIVYDKFFMFLYIYLSLALLFTFVYIYLIIKR